MRGWTLGAAIVLALATVAGTVGADEQAAPPASLAVVELFTSEGCSSCPPADRLLIRLGEEAAAGRTPVLPLAFHVDYWDDIGWPDPFGDPRWSARQRGYAASAGTGRLYTPMAVIGGRSEAVGHNEDLLRRRIEAAASKPMGSRPAVEARFDSARSVTVRWTLDGTGPDDAVLSVLLVQGPTKVAVTAGENGGKELPHAHVVRELLPVGKASEHPRGEMTLVLPKGFVAEGASAVVLVQRPGPGEVVGAAQAPIRVAKQAK